MKKIVHQCVEWFLSENRAFVRVVLLFLFLGITSLLGFFLDSQNWSVVGYVLVPIILLGGVIFNGVFYLQDIYEIQSFSNVLNYLLGAIFGFPQTSLKIANGKKVIKDGEVNTLDHIGGPGMLKVEPGNVVVLETLLAPSRIIGAGEHPVGRGEIIKDIIVLEEYSGKIGEIIVSTRDGIDVKVVDVEYRFCINQINHDESLRTFQNPYPFSQRSVRNLAYGRNVSAEGKVGLWTDAVQGAIKGIISEHISNIEHIIPRTELERFFIYQY